MNNFIFEQYITGVVFSMAENYNEAKDSARYHALGVCIPTYNRIEFLQRSLELFISQSYDNDIGIYVSNNASTDNTQNYLREIEKTQQSVLHFQSNSHNLGYAGNVLEVLSMAKSNFVWLFGDDDEITDDAVSRVGKYLESGYDFLVVNSVNYDEKMKYVKQNRVLPLDSDLIIEPDGHNKLLEFIGKSSAGYVGFMGAIITKTEYLEDTLRNAGIDRNSEFIHIPLFYKSIVGKRGIVIAEPLIKKRDGNYRVNVKTWADSFPRSIMSLAPEYEVQGLLEQFRKNVQNAILFTVITNKLVRGLKFSDIKKEIVESRNFIKFGTMMLMILVSLTPVSLLRLIFPRIKKIASKDTKTNH